MDDFGEKSNDTVFVLFHSKKCKYCLEVEKYIYEIGKLGFPIKLVNIKEEPDLCLKYSVMETPTVVVFQNGRIKAHLPGVHPESKYMSFINDDVIYSDNLK